VTEKDFKKPTAATMEQGTAAAAAKLQLFWSWFV